MMWDEERPPNASLPATMNTHCRRRSSPSSPITGLSGRLKMERFGV